MAVYTVENIEVPKVRLLAPMEKQTRRFILIDGRPHMDVTDKPDEWIAETVALFNRHQPHAAADDGDVDG